MSQLTGTQLKQVESALLSAYDKGSLARMVRFELDENLDAIVVGSNLEAIVFDLITWAERRGMTEKLIESACRGNPRNPELRALADAAKGWKRVDAGPPEAPVNPAHPLAPAPVDDSYAYDTIRKINGWE